MTRSDSSQCLLRIRTGRVQEYSDAPAASETRFTASEKWASAISKNPVEGTVTITPLGIEGDEHADLQHHGGPEKAILCYSREHYASWSQELGPIAPPPGTLGENFEIGGTSEDEICIGDTFEIGGIVVQLSQPRQPCWKPARLHKLAQLTAQILKTGRTGWYLRVLQGGSVAAPAPIHLIERPHPEWTVAHATRVMHFEKDARLRADLAEVEALSAAWKAALLGEN
jgi:MOSC domain-containing protein YiiM